MSATPRRAAPAVVALALLLAACASPGGSGNSASPSAAASQAGGTTANVTVAHTSAGDALAGPNGMTLYVFTNDSSGTSTCTGGCASTWPPFTLSSGQTAAAGSGVTASMLGTIQRSDGTTQVTYNGQPLYYYSGDSAAGDANGQGINGIWFIAPPSGTLPAASGSPSSTGNPGYIKY